MMRLKSALIAATLGSSLMIRGAFAADIALLSITGISLDPQYSHLTKVVIHTWGVEVLAICHIPKVSVVSVDFDLDPGGVLIWKANSWHGELDDSTTREALSALFLVRISSYQKEPRGRRNGDFHPASFEGIATTATVQEPQQERSLPLSWQNFDLAPAVRCPDPG